MALAYPDEANQGEHTRDLRNPPRIAFKRGNDVSTWVPVVYGV